MGREKGTAMGASKIFRADGTLRGGSTNAGATMLDRLLDEHEAADFLSLSVKTLRRWRWSRRGPPWFRVGGTAVRYRLSELSAFVDAGRQETSAA
jgi:predicted DNA-binding transcriptional regulator AlpA